MHGKKAAGASCVEAAECAPVCCSCATGNSTWLGAACLDGACSNANVVCGQTQKVDQITYCGAYGTPLASSTPVGASPVGAVPTPTLDSPVTQPISVPAASCVKRSGLFQVTVDLVSGDGICTDVKRSQVWDMNQLSGGDLACHFQSKLDPNNCSEKLTDSCSTGIFDSGGSLTFGKAVWQLTWSQDGRSAQGTMKGTFNDISQFENCSANYTVTLVAQ